MALVKNNSIRIQFVNDKRQSQLITKTIISADWGKVMEEVNQITAAYLQQGYTVQAMRVVRTDCTSLRGGI